MGFVCYKQIIIPWHMVRRSWKYVCVLWPSQLRVVEMLIIAHLSFIYLIMSTRPCLWSKPDEFSSQYHLMF